MFEVVLDLDFTKEVTKKSGWKALQKTQWKIKDGTLFGTESTQENQVKKANLTEEDKEEDMVLRSNGDLLKMVLSELLSESIYSTNKLR